MSDCLKSLAENLKHSTSVIEDIRKFYGELELNTDLIDELEEFIEAATNNITGVKDDIEFIEEKLRGSRLGRI
jgi:hypothetical protein